jgi:hypothetical protein
MTGIGYHKAKQLLLLAAPREGAGEEPEVEAPEIERDVDAADLAAFTWWAWCLGRATAEEALPKALSKYRERYGEGPQRVLLQKPGALYLGPVEVTHV